MISSSENLYARRRPPVRDARELRDEPFPAERLVQAIWQHQRVRRSELKTTEGKSVRVLHPGFASLEGGPDFRGAVLQIGDKAPFSGDVEVDLRAAGWRAHGHDRNPNFKNVLLHVVWEDDDRVHAPAHSNDSTANQQRFHSTILPLKNVLDAPLAELSLSLENESLRSLPENLRGKCCAPLRELGEIEVARLLNHAGQVRFENKAAEFRARAKNVGWEQALWDSLFRALGYKHNIWPMQHLAELRTRLLESLPGRQSEMLLALQARLLGISGLLPDELTRTEKSTDSYLKRIWGFWWRERDIFSDVLLPRMVWRFHGLRPSNHPRRRLALASHWMANKDFISKIEKWIANAKDGEIPRVACRRLTDILKVERDDFWSWHLTLKSVRSKTPQPLLGESRVTDLAVNVILPWLWTRAAEGGNEKIKSEVERRFFSWPPAEDNSILKLARQRLLGTSNGKILRTGAEQQGLIQIVRDFCEHSNAACHNCGFPELVRKWPQGGQAKDPLLTPSRAI